MNCERSVVASFVLFGCQKECVGLVNYVDRDVLWNIFGSLLIFAVPLAFISLNLYFCTEEIFNSWFKFARIYFPIVLIIAILTSFGSGGSNWGPHGPDGIAITWVTSGLFLLISMTIIVVKNFKKPPQKI